MKKLILILFAINVFALDFPGDTRPFSDDPSWNDPTIPEDINGEKERQMLNKATEEIKRRQDILKDMDEEKLIKLKQALDILFAEENKKNEEKEEKEEQVKYKPDPSEIIEINIHENGKKYKSTPKNQKSNIEIRIN